MPILDTDRRGCGTYVYFNQASMYQSAETDSESLKAARLAGKKTTVCYTESIKAALEDYSYVYDASAKLPTT